MARASHLARLALLVALCGAVSGLPVTVAAALDEGGCADCHAPADAGRCPPNCDVGPCAKVFPSLASPSAGVAVPRDTRAGIAADAARPALTPVERGVFHPPRA